MSDEQPSDPDATVIHTPASGSTPGSPSGPSSGRSSGPELPVVHARSGEELPETAASQLKAGQVLFGRYGLKRVLGRGGFGVVWLADDRELDIEVALKFLADHIASSHDSVQDLKGEARRSLRLTHPNIVRIFNFIQEASLVGISMEYVGGGSLPQIRAARNLRAFGLAELAPLIGQLCEALEYAHTKPRIVHRDLKPANLMLDTRGELKIADFGISRSISDSHTRLTSPGDSSGTLAYMSPQQMMGELPRPSDDVYSLGATIFDLLTGKPPFHSGDVVRQAMNITPTRINLRRRELGVEGDDIPETWEEVVAACLAKDPIDRPAGAFAVAEQLGLRAATGSSRGVTAPLPSQAADQTVVLGSIPGAAIDSRRTTTPAVPTGPTVSGRGGGSAGGSGVGPAGADATGSMPGDAWPGAPRRGGLSPVVIGAVVGGLVLIAGGIVVVPRLLRSEPGTAVGPNVAGTNGVGAGPAVPSAPTPAATAPVDSVGRTAADGTDSDATRASAEEVRRAQAEAETGRREAEERARRLEDELATARRRTESGATTDRARPPVDRRTPSTDPRTPAATTPAADPPARGTSPAHGDRTNPDRAGADHADGDHAAINRAAQGIVSRYEAAIEALDVGAYAALWQRLPDATRKALANSFRDTESITLDVSNVEVDPPDGDQTVVRFRENRTITPKAGPKQTVSRDVRMTLVRQSPGEWRIQASVGS